MTKKTTFIPYDKASKTEQRKRDNAKRSKIIIPPNQPHKSVNDYSRHDSKEIVGQEVEELEQDK